MKTLILLILLASNTALANPETLGVKIVDLKDLTMASGLSFKEECLKEGKGDKYSEFVCWSQSALIKLVGVGFQ